MIQTLKPRTDNRLSKTYGERDRLILRQAVPHRPVFYVIHLLILCFLADISLAATSVSSAGIIAGYKYGTNMSIARDMQLVSALHGENIRLVSSKGALENVFSVLKSQQSQMAMTETFYLNHMIREKQDKKLSNLRYILPLHTSDLHILANRNIKTIRQLNGKRVSIGSPSGSTWLVAHSLLEQLDINYLPVTDLTPDDALNALKNDELDAMIYLSGAPVRLFQDNIQPDDRLNLLEVPFNQGNLSGLNNGTIKRGTYDWLKSDINTKVSRVLLLTYNHPTKHQDQQNRQKDISHCLAARRAYRATLINMDFLKRYGHPKWSEVAINVNDMMKSPFPISRYHCTWRNTF